MELDETGHPEQAWDSYDRWLSDPRIGLYAEPYGHDLAFRGTTPPFAAQTASKMVGDCYLMAYAGAHGATLVTLDKGLRDLARKWSSAGWRPGGVKHATTKFLHN